MTDSPEFEQSFAVVAVRANGEMRVFPVIAADRVAAADAVRDVLAQEQQNQVQAARPQPGSDDAGGQLADVFDVRGGLILVLSEDELDMTLRHVRMHKKHSDHA